MEIVNSRFCKRCQVFKPVDEFSSTRLKCKQCMYEIHLLRRAHAESKTCTKCKEIKPGEEFYYDSLICKVCILSRSRSHMYDPANNYFAYRYKMWGSALARARTKQIAFEIEPDDIFIPERCPVFNFPLIIEPGPIKPNTPALDRTKPELGYVLGNINVISSKANTIKSNASVEDIQALLNWFRSVV